MKKLICIIVLGGLSLMLVACGGNNVQTPEFDFSIAYIEDLSEQGVRRYRYRVVVSDEVSPACLENLSRYITEDVKADKDFNALQIWFFDYAEFSAPGRSSHTLGEATYAPEGNWARASAVTAGNYRTFDFSFNIPEKDWSLRLSPEEAAIFGEWRFVSESAPTADEEFVNNRVAYLLGISLEEISDVMQRQLIWTHNRG